MLHETRDCMKKKGKKKKSRDVDSPYSQLIVLVFCCQLHLRFCLPGGHDGSVILISVNISP